MRGGSSLFSLGISTIISGDFCDTFLRLALLGGSNDLKKRFKTYASLIALLLFIRLLSITSD